MNYADYPLAVVQDIARLRRRIAASGLPAKQVDRNLLVGTWNLKRFAQVYDSWDENPGSPKRNLRAMAIIAEVIRHLDVVAVQEVAWDTGGVRLLLDRFLGPEWAIVVSDVSGGAQGNGERLTFLYDRRRVEPRGLAGEIVLPPTDRGDPVQQFARTPYLVGFRSCGESFSLLTAHIKYGKVPADRRPEIEALSGYTATQIRDRAQQGAEESNLIVLGDFNIDDRNDNPLFQAFTETGLMVPTALLNLPSAFGTQPKYYDQIAWFMGAMDLLSQERAGVINFAGAVYPELTLQQMSYRVSDHLPLWVEFIVDRSTESMARTLGVDPASPDPLSIVPD
jgi:endonuclease/exonuclease/phosphatase family metal-dependent hydrolase